MDGIPPALFELWKPLQSTIDLTRGTLLTILPKMQADDGSYFASAELAEWACHHNILIILAAPAHQDTLDKDDSIDNSDQHLPLTINPEEDPKDDDIIQVTLADLSSEDKEKEL